jgi:hypothetical protein
MGEVRRHRVRLIAQTVRSVNSVFRQAPSRRRAISETAHAWKRCESGEGSAQQQKIDKVHKPALNQRRHDDG